MSWSPPGSYSFSFNYDPTKFAKSQETLEALTRAQDLRTESSREMQLAEELADDAWGQVRVDEVTDATADVDEAHLGTPAAMPPA